MKLFPEETTLFESNNKTLTLTTHRIRYEAKSWGGLELRSIMLEELASCAMVRKSKPAFLVLAGLFLLSGIAFQSLDDGFPVAGAVVAVVFVLIWFLTRRQTLSLASAGASINVDATAMKSDALRDFIGAIEAAKLARTRPA